MVDTIDKMDAIDKQGFLGECLGALTPIVKKYFPNNSDWVFGTWAMKGDDETVYFGGEEIKLR